MTQTNYQQSKTPNLHTAEELETYLKCPMKWAFLYVWKKEDVLSTADLYWKLYTSYVRQALDTQSKLHVDVHQLVDTFGDYVITHSAGITPSTRDKMIVDGAAALRSCYEEVFAPDIVGVDLPASTYVHPRVPEDGAVTMRIAAVQHPFRLIFVSSVPVYYGHYARWSPVRFTAAAVHSRAWHDGHHGRVARSPKPILFAPDISTMSLVNHQASWYHSGPSWTRALECMDMIGAYPRPSSDCAICPFRNECSPEFANIRNMKIKGPNKTIDPIHSTRRRHARKNKTRPNQTDNSNLQ